MREKLNALSNNEGEPLSEASAGPFQKFLKSEAAAGVLLIACALGAMIWANSPWSQIYQELWHLEFGSSFRAFEFRMSLLHWINDGLMAWFFFYVGLEIKREVLGGELSSLRKAALPIAAALGGMLVPALIYTAFNRGGEGAPGWGIPMATDIAFALGVLSLLGKRVPMGLRVFLATLAVADDIGAVIVIAVFYNAQIHWLMFAMIGAVLALFMLANRTGVRNPLIYLLLGIATWLFVLQSGIHASIAGVLVAMTIPTYTSKRMLHALHPWVSYFIMPLFALANAGIVFGHDAEATIITTVTIGVLLGLLLGKAIGITLFAWLAVKLRIARLPESVSWRQLHGAAWLGGIGFTMSIFIATLAFENEGLELGAKVGILAASVIAGVVGWLVLRFSE